MVYFMSRFSVLVPTGVKISYGVSALRSESLLMCFNDLFIHIGVYILLVSATVFVHVISCHKPYRFVYHRSSCLIRLTLA